MYSAGRVKGQQEQNMDKKTPRNFRLPTPVLAMLAEISEQTGMTATAAVEQAVREFYHNHPEYQKRNGNKMNDNLLAIANAMYRELSGADNRQEKAELVDEIYNWLREGDAKNLTLADVPDLLNEWREYSGE